MTILVTGARGHVGGAVLTGLLAAGQAVRASSRDPRPASPVHERDIAEVVVRALLDDTHRRTAYPELGAGPLTVREQVAAIAEALGESVRLDEVDVDAYRSELLTQLPEVIVDRLVQARGQVRGRPAELGTDAVPAVLGRPALTFAEWARDHAADFR